MNFIKTYFNRDEACDELTYYQSDDVRVAALVRSLIDEQNIKACMSKQSETSDDTSVNAFKRALKKLLNSLNY